MKATNAARWGITAILVFVMLSGGIGEMTHQWGTLDTARVLGYPVYFLTIIGAWKVLGSIALLVPGFPRLREWACLGAFFNMTGAAASHALAGDWGPYAFHVTVTSCLALLALALLAFQPRTSQQPEAARAAATRLAAAV
jgi:DoxX-like protein